jgi:hypothetical protein
MESQKLELLQKETLENAQIIEDMVYKVINEYSSDLDLLMADLKEGVTQPDALSTNGVERYYAELSNLVYFMCQRIEKLNILSDLSKAQLKERYNKAYISISSEKDERGKSIHTINENTAFAESESKYESTLNIIYDQAYKTLKMKVDMAMEMISTLKNILKRRIQEEYLNSAVSNLNSKMED